MAYAVVITGLPGSGKTTLARSLAAALSIPLLSKDLIKESLASGPVSPEESRRLGALAFETMYSRAGSLSEVVLETYFHPGRSEPALLALGRPLIQVHCACPGRLAQERFEQRIARGERHPVHHDTWDPLATSRLALPGPFLEVDTSQPVDVALLVSQVVAAT